MPLSRGKSVGAELHEHEDGRLVVKERRRKKRLWVRSERTGSTPDSRQLLGAAGWISVMVAAVLLGLGAAHLWSAHILAQRPRFDEIRQERAADGTIRVYRNDRLVKSTARGDKHYEEANEAFEKYGIPAGSPKVKVLTPQEAGEMKRDAEELKERLKAERKDRHKAGTADRGR